MSRSLKKGPYVAYALLKKARVEKQKPKKYRRAVRTWSRSSTVVPVMVGVVINIHNGLYHRVIFIKDDMVGHKLGEFAPTRKFKGHIKKNKRVRR